MELSAAARRFVLHWGSMGSSWGVNRTVAQIHALLYLAPRPLHAEEIVDTLGVARSNVSNSLRELIGWGLVRRVQVLGDRRDHFEALGDVWEMFRRVMEERQRREFDPTLAMLREGVAELEAAGEGRSHTARRLGEMLEFFESTTAWYDELRRLPVGALRRLMKLGRKVRQLVEPRGGKR